MIDGLFKKALVFVVIILFVGASIVTSVTGHEKIEDDYEFYDPLEKNQIEKNILDNENYGRWWQLTELVSSESDDRSFSPSIDVDRYERVHVAWCDSSEYGDSGCDVDIFYKTRDKSGEWSTTEVVSIESYKHSVNPSLAVHQNNGVYIAWREEVEEAGGFRWDIFIRQKVYFENWKNVEVVSTETDGLADNPSLAVALDGSVHVAWHESSDYGNSDMDYDIFYRQRTSDGTWTATELVSTESSSTSWYPSLAVESDGTVHVAWVELLSDKNEIHYKKRTPDGTWTTREVISAESSHEPYAPSLDVDRLGGVHIAWMDDRGKNPILMPKYDISYRYKPKGENWYPIEIIYECNKTASFCPSLEVGSDDFIHVVWNEYAPQSIDHEIYYTHKQIGENYWEVIEWVSDQTQPMSFDPSLATDKNGVVHVAWTCCTKGFNSSEDKDIFYRFRKDLSRPHVSIIKPRQNTLYSRNNEIGPFPVTFIIGSIDLIVNAFDYESGIERVEFYVDNEQKFNDDTSPYYSWRWDEFSFGRHTLKVIAYDNAGNTDLDKMETWKFF